MIKVFLAEGIKIRRSLVLLVSITPPAMVFLLSFLMVSTDKGGEWPMFVLRSAGIWAFFLFPMSVIGITALLAQIEYDPGGWSHVMALPVGRWKIFAAKAVLALLLCLLVSALVALATVGGGVLGGVVSPNSALQGAIPWALMIRLFGSMYLAGGLMMAVQWAVAMQFRSFAVPVSVGIGGTFVAISATSTEYGIYFPWLMPTNVMASDPARAEFAIALGSVGGVVLFVLTILWLSRRDWK